MQDTPIDATRKYVNGIVWPADKETVVQIVERNGAPPDMVQLLRDSDKHRFVTPSEVQYTLWRAV